MSQNKSTTAFRNYAWIFTAYLIGVILFGAWVRITHSGAGCGDHWPTCHGDVIPFEPSTETMIEYTHRLTSGLCGIFGIILVGWAYRIRGAGRVFGAALLTLILIIFEGAIGAGIVLGELVKNDDSAARAIVISLHLVNTLLLTGASSLTAWWTRPEPDNVQSYPGWAKPLIYAGAFLLIATSMTGAITALGDTLFPVDPTTGDGLFARVRDDLSTTNHFLVQLRIVHPIVAVVTATFVFWFASLIRHVTNATVAARLALALMITIGAQILLGLLNVALYAPGLVQLSHLAVAQAVWILFVLMSFEITRPSPATQD